MPLQQQQHLLPHNMRFKTLRVLASGIRSRSSTHRGQLLGSVLYSDTFLDVSGWLSVVAPCIPARCGALTLCARKLPPLHWATGPQRSLFSVLFASRRGAASVQGQSHCAPKMYICWQLACCCCCCCCCRCQRYAAVLLSSSTSLPHTAPSTPSTFGALKQQRARSWSPHSGATCSTSCSSSCRQLHRHS
jgi:hypothetical protein